MCDYCDCRSTTEIAELSAEHEVLLHLLRALGASARSGDEPMGAIVASLRALLPSHARREERGILAELRLASVPAGYVEEFEGEHVEIERLLAEVDGPAWRDASEHLVALLGDHILREESDLYPAAHQLLADSQWDRIAGGHLAATSR